MNKITWTMKASRKAEGGREGAMRSLLMVGAVALAVSVPALRCVSAQTAPLHYGDPPVVLVGTLATEVFYGPPGYGENPTLDAKEKPFMIDVKSVHPQATDGLRPDDGKVRAEVGQVKTKVGAGVQAPNYDGSGDPATRKDPR
ncbi:MAG: hypothetical protein NTX64_08180 [Elusimicrobia bacterium]|nr:hypothetical protein [Elusimicrobiota bacterium]